MMTQYKTIPTGRFAPSPTGSLHIGSLMTAVASFADARAAGGRWLVRMEDVDTTRMVPGSADDIMHTLEAFGFEWDGEVVYQSRRSALYRAAAEQLMREGRVYPCFCSRKQILAEARCTGADGAVYGGRCADLTSEERRGNVESAAWRLRTQPGVFEFDDAVFGRCRQNPFEETGDFLLKRRDGIWSYQLAVTVDDALQGVTRVVRGGDLLSSTGRQVYLQQLLGLPTPRYAHMPLLLNASGKKWSKQENAPALDGRRRIALLKRVLLYLNLPEPPECGNPRDLLAWAVQHWDVSRIAPEPRFAEALESRHPVDGNRPAP